MSTAIMQAGALGWDYKAFDWGSSSEIVDIPHKVSAKNPRKYLI